MSFESEIRSEAEVMFPQLVLGGHYPANVTAWICAYAGYLSRAGFHIKELEHATQEFFQIHQPPEPKWRPVTQADIDNQKQKIKEYMKMKGGIV